MRLVATTSAYLGHLGVGVMQTGRALLLPLRPRIDAPGGIVQLPDNPV